MVKLGSLKVKLMHNISQTGSSRNLGKHHDNELAPAAKMAVLALWFEPILLDSSKIMSVKKLKQLIEDCVRMCQGLNLLSCQWVRGNRTIPRKTGFGPILFS